MRGWGLRGLEEALVRIDALPVLAHAAGLDVARLVVKRAGETLRVQVGVPEAHLGFALGSKFWFHGLNTLAMC